MPDPSIQPFTSVFRAGGANRIKRSRPPVSCRACQRRKSKCDRQRPCGACEKRNEGAQCHFGSHSAGNGGHEGGRHEIQARVNKLEELVRGLADSGKSPVPPGSAEVPAGGDQEASERIYAGPLSWRALMDSIHDIQDVLGMERDGSPSHDIEENTTASDVLIGEGPRITIKEVAAAMPSKQETDRLVMTYFGAKFLAVPFIHTHQFRRCYEAFWEDPSSQSFLWISLMFSVLSMGAFIAESKNADSKPPSPVLEPNFFMAQAARCLVVGDYLRAKRLSVEATLAHAHSRHIQKRDSDSNVWTLYGVATRLALRRGYHRDYTKVSANITPFEAEMRRRTWFLISSSDTLLSFQHGLPPIIHDDLCDTGHLTNLTDEDFDEDTILPPPRPRTDPLPTLAYVFKSKLAVTLRRIIHHVLRPLSNDNYQETTFILQSNLEEWHAAIPPCFHYRTISSTAFTDPNYTIMHRIMLEIMCRKAMCVLHRPYLSVRGKGNEYKLSREICRDSALKLMNIHLELDAAIQPGGRLYEDRYMLNSLTLTEFLVAAMIICVDLSESIDMSLETQQSRLSLLRASHKIWLSKTHESRDAVHASKVLGAILRRVESKTAGSSEDITMGVRTSRQLPTPVSTIGSNGASNGQSQESDNVDDMMQLDDFFANQGDLDWSVIDQYLTQDVYEEQPSGWGLWATMAEHTPGKSSS